MESSPKNENSLSLQSLKLFQTCMSFFLLLNTEEDILKNVCNQTDLLYYWRYNIHSRKRKYYGSQSVDLFDYKHSFTYFLCVQHKKETHTGLEQLEGNTLLIFGW